MLKLLYITNNDRVALAAERSGVNRIWIDLEVLGKEQRQKNLNTVKSAHTVEDIKRIAPLLEKSDLLVRINPWNENSKKEIDEVVDAGADIVMLPYWKTKEEVFNFVTYLNGRCRSLLLLETKEAVEKLESVLEIEGIDEIHIGLNDLRLSYGFKDMFEPFANGLLDRLSDAIKNVGIPFGIGGIGQFGLGLSPSPEELIAEHYRLGSTAVILSRTFCNAEKLGDIDLIEKTLTENIKLLRKTEVWASKLEKKGYEDNHSLVVKALEG